ncbi:tRNA 2'-phosphotransferase 1 [Symbiodinium microadriaticum]|uniref:tRNA 2'-phosphotransferase 1 n=1 Tax=Symbiodinium microadriaticum TaxID=2951 RepID=A0A1Q9CH13_SYMMI|nr:tRNA 2'-phosphotransferase 1 [Symbiodinium microadriaticum]
MAYSMRSTTDAKTVGVSLWEPEEEGTWRAEYGPNRSAGEHRGVDPAVIGDLITRPRCSQKTTIAANLATEATKLKTAVTASRISELVNTPKLRALRVKSAEIRSAISTNAKQRFELVWKDGEEMARAVQGHSFEVEKSLISQELSEADLPATVYHGTTSDCYRSITRDGLLAGGPRKVRADVHFVEQMPGSSAVISGARSNCTLALVVDAKKAARIATAGLSCLGAEWAQNNRLPPPLWSAKRLITQ